MALIFDNFTSLANAAAFAGEAKTRFGRDAAIYTNADEAAEAGFFPFVLTAPVVLVDRDEDYADEDTLRTLVKNFQGEFAGT